MKLYYMYKTLSKTFLKHIKNYIKTVGLLRVFNQYSDCYLYLIRIRIALKL